MHATRIPTTRTSIPINRTRVRAAAMIGHGFVRSGIEVDEAAAQAARDVPEHEADAVRVAVELLALEGGDA